MANSSNQLLFRLCEVLSVIDDNDGLRIKVRLYPEDVKYKTIEELPYCFPILPKHLHINPKVGECVLVFLSTINQSESNRFFLGPLISQPYTLNFDPFYYRSRCLLNGKWADKPLPKHEMNPENDGTVPGRDDIAIQGRQNTDIILKNSEIRLRCGFKKYPTGDTKSTLLFNREDLGYIQMRYKRLKDHNNNEFSSVVNVVADRINLLSHNSKNLFTMNDRKDLITDEELLKILKEAHPLPYGDELIDFLKKLIEVIRTHTHPFSMDPPCFTTPQIEVLETPLENMLSQSIRIN